MKNTESISYYEDKEHIEQIISILKKYSYGELRKRDYFSYSLMEKNTDEEMLEKYYPQFDRIRLIAYRERAGKQPNYDIYYETDEGFAVIFAIDINKSPPVLVNAFSFNKNLKNFMKFAVKKYGDKMI